MCWKLQAPGKAHFPRFHDRQMRLEVVLGSALAGSWHLGRDRPLLPMSRAPDEATDAFLVGGVTVHRAQSSVLWSTSLQIAHGVIGVSAWDAMYAMCREGSS